MAGSAAQVLDQAGATLKPESFGRALIVPIDKLRPNAWNPNVQDEETFRHELASIRRFGFVDPVICRLDGAMYEIIDGEHRWRAARELGYTELPVYDVGPIATHEAKQLTIVLNELRGKPQPKKLAEILRDLLSGSTLDELTEVLPYSKEEYGRLAELPEYDWDGFREKVQRQQANRWIERVFRLPAEVADVLDRAIQEAKRRDGRGDAEAIGIIASSYLGEGE